jgi:hypothetical protein
MNPARVWAANIPLGPHVLSFYTFKGRQICFDIPQTDSPTVSPTDPPPEEEEETGEEGGERRALRVAPAVEGLVQLEEKPKARST